MNQKADDIKVAVAGGGISGLTAALRLAQRGYKVTLFEQKPWLGGNLAARPGARLTELDPDPRISTPMVALEGHESRTLHDVYPHMYPDFYANFWEIVERDLGMRRDDTSASDFEPHDNFQFLGRDGKYRALGNAWEPEVLWNDLFSAVDRTAPADMFLFLYSFLDLICHRCPRSGPLTESVTAFLESRPCSTDKVARLHDLFITLIWAIHASDTEAASYRTFMHHALGHSKPLLWLLKGNLQKKLIGPLERKLTALGVDIRKQTQVVQVFLTDNAVTSMDVVNVCFDYKRQMVEPNGKTVESFTEFDYLVLAVPPKALASLAVLGPPGRRITDHVPCLANADVRLPTAQLGVLDLYFKHKLDGVPRDNVAYTDSKLYFSFIDISRLWGGNEMAGITALTVAASDYWAFPGISNQENAMQMIRQIHRSFPQFDPGRQVGDSPDIDWDRTFYSTSKSETLFLNQVGSWDYRPKTHYRSVSNLFFAGDFCRNDFDMATVEAAVESGIDAAIALQRAAPLGARIQKAEAPLIPEIALKLFKLQLAPCAYTAKYWQTVQEASMHLSDELRRANAADAAVTLMKLPYQYMADWVETVGSIWKDFLIPGSARER